MVPIHHGGAAAEGAEALDEFGLRRTGSQRPNGGFVSLPVVAPPTGLGDVLNGQSGRLGWDLAKLARGVGAGDQVIKLGRQPYGFDLRLNRSLRVCTLLRGHDLDAVATTPQDPRNCNRDARSSSATS